MTFAELFAMQESLSNLPGVDTSIIGYSLLGKPVYSFHVGNYDDKQIILEGAIHAREYVSALVLIKEVEFLSTQTLAGGIYIVPLTNPDGVELVMDGDEFIPCEKQREFIEMVNDHNPSYNLWKANLNAVDLNVNFNAYWGQGSQNVFCVAPANFIGYYPESEREVQNLIKFTQEVNPKLTISYHTKGEVIYYGFESLTPEEILRDYEIANIFSKENGYAPVKTENSVAGYSDYISLNYKVPAFTMEMGNVNLPTPIPTSYAQELFELNKNIPIIALGLI